MHYACFALIALVLVSCGASQRHVLPKYESDRFALEVQRGCTTLADCEALELRAFHRGNQCIQDYRDYSTNLLENGSGFTVEPKCPEHVLKDYRDAQRLAEHQRQLVQEREALRVAATAAHDSAAREQAEREQEAQQERESTEAERKRVAVETAAKLPAAALPAISAQLCVLRDNLEQLKSEKAYNDQVDRESGTVALGDRRDLAEATIDARAQIECAESAIREWFKTAPISCARLAKTKLEPDAQLLVDMRYYARLGYACEDDEE